MTTNAAIHRLDQLFMEEKWKRARVLILKELNAMPRDEWMRHWWLTRLSTTYYEERDYREAIRLALEAHDIAPDCPLVLWDLAGALDMFGDKSGAIDTYRRIEARGARSLGEDQCGEGLEWAEALITDALYRRGLCLSEIGKDADSLADLKAAVVRLGKGQQGIYTREEAIDAYSRVYKRIMTGRVATQDRSPSPSDFRLSTSASPALIEGLKATRSPLAETIHEVGLLCKSATRGRSSVAGQKP